MANFTKISKYRMGEPRFGRAGDEPANGPVVTYHLSPDEIAQRYGPPVPVKKTRRHRITREYLEEKLASLTVGQLAERLQVPQEIIFRHVTEYGLELDEKNRLKEGDDVAAFEPYQPKYGDKIQAARDVLPREEFEEMVKQGLADKEVAEVKKIDLHLVKKLKRKYGLTGIVPHRGGRPRKERKNMENLENQTVEQAQEDKESSKESGNIEKLSVAKLIELRALLEREIKCHEKLDSLFRNNVTELSPGVKGILTEHRSECQSRLDWIDKTFAETLIEVPNQV